MNGGGRFTDSALVTRDCANEHTLDQPFMNLFVHSYIYTYIIDYVQSVNQLTSNSLISIFCNVTLCIYIKSHICIYVFMYLCKYIYVYANSQKIKKLLLKKSRQKNVEKGTEILRCCGSHT